MIVDNSVSHDARVLKEANSLSRRGYPVTILGLADKKDLPADERLANGVQILRVTRHQITALHLFFAVVCVGYISGFSMLIGRWFAPLAPYVIAVSSLLALYIFFKTAWLIACTKSLKIFRCYCWQRNVLHQLQSFDPEIVHCHDVLTLPIGCTHKHRHHCKLVFDSHELGEHQRRAKWKRKMLVLMQMLCSRHVDGFITVNERIARYFAEHYPHLPTPTVVMNATKPHSSPLSYDGRLHEAARLPTKTRILLYQGGFSKGRGLSTLVRAGSLLPKDWCLVMMGGGRYETALRLIAKEHSPSRNKVHFVPSAPQAELPHWTVGASVGAILYENTCLNNWFCSPNKLWEYPNAGVPILARCLPELERVIQQNAIGWFLPDPVEPQDIADFIAHLSDKELDSKGRNCRDFIRQDNWNVYERRLLELYDELRVGSVSGL